MSLPCGIWPLSRQSGHLIAPLSRPHASGAFSVAAVNPASHLPRCSVKINIIREILELALLEGLILQEGRRSGRKRSPTCHPKSARSESAQHWLSVSPRPRFRSRSVRRSPRPQTAANTQRRIGFIMSALFTRPIGRPGGKPKRYLMGRSTDSCPTFLRTRSGCRAIRSCRASGFSVHRATCRRVPAPISTGTFSNTPSADLLAVSWSAIRIAVCFAATPVSMNEIARATFAALFHAPASGPTANRLAH